MTYADLKKFPNTAITSAIFRGAISSSCASLQSCDLNNTRVQRWKILKMGSWELFSSLSLSRQAEELQISSHGKAWNSPKNHNNWTARRNHDSEEVWNKRRFSEEVGDHRDVEISRPSTRSSIERRIREHSTSPAWHGVAKKVVERSKELFLESNWSWQSWAFIS